MDLTETLRSRIPHSPPKLIEIPVQALETQTSLQDPPGAQVPRNPARSQRLHRRASEMVSGFAPPGDMDSFFDTLALRTRVPSTCIREPATVHHAATLGCQNSCTSFCSSVVRCLRRLLLPLSFVRHRRSTATAPTDDALPVPFMQKAKQGIYIESSALSSGRAPETPMINKYALLL